MSVNEQLACRKLRKSNASDVEEVDSHDIADFASAVLAEASPSVEERIMQVPVTNIECFGTFLQLSRIRVP